MKEDKLYSIRKLTVMIACMLVIVTVGLGVIKFQSKKVTINYYGNIVEVTTMSNTVEGLLMQNNIYINEKAIVYPSVDSRITNNMEIKIYDEEIVAKLDIEKYKNDIEIVEKREEKIQYINFDEEERTNASIERGTNNILVTGEKGEKVIVEIATYENDIKTKSIIISENFLKEPVSQIMEVGTKAPVVSRSSTFRLSEGDLIVDSGFIKYNISLSEDLQKYTYNMCKKYGVPYEVMLGLMKVESGYNANAVGGSAIGLCQISSSNLTYLKNNIGITNLKDPYQNIKAGTYWLSRYINAWSKSVSGDTILLHSLNSYNWGDSRYREYLSQGNTATSWYYGRKVLGVRDSLLASVK